MSESKVIYIIGCDWFHWRIIMAKELEMAMNLLIRNCQLESQHVQEIQY
jgi:hypothetical protein